MKISIARMIANLSARGRVLGNRFAWWSPCSARHDR
jgi:hypothetical protein